MSGDTYDAARHYDRVTPAWRLLLGEELHYGVFESGAEPLAAATANLTALMAGAAQLAGGLSVLDVGCGTGAPACHLAATFGVEVTGITTSQVGVSEAAARAERLGLAGRARFLARDGMANGFADESFDRVWVLESSHLMRDRAALVSECARVLRPGGRMVLCDIIARRDLPFLEVRKLLEPLSLLRRVFGDARMEQLSTYTTLATDRGLIVEVARDLTAETRPTFDRWEANAHAHRDEVVAQLGATAWDDFVGSCAVLRGFWDDGTFGYGLLAAVRP